jgi:UDP-2,4-diacetamido-2,4,6-trideoxy-beta-L-altropyranose hydrolase
MRCLALAQVWSTAAGSCEFVLAHGTPELESRIGEEGFRVDSITAEPGSDDDVRQTLEITHERNAAWVVIDGYRFTADYQRAIKNRSCRLVVVDDGGLGDSCVADIVVNQNPFATAVSYTHCAPSTALLLGTRYALLRREFWTPTPRFIMPGKAERLLVTFGGSDPDNVTSVVLQALKMTPTDGGEVIVVVGDGNPHYDSVVRQARDLGRKVRIERGVRKMSELMGWADLAISAAGGTCWELAAMGVPMILIPIADNQTPVADILERKRAAVNLGPAWKLSAERIAQATYTVQIEYERRKELLENARGLVDGKGAHRVITAMMDKQVTIRNADAGDIQLLWEWANEPAVRAASFSRDPIPWGDHQHWMERRLADPHTRLYVGIDSADLPVGQVRFDLHGSDAILSVTVDPKFRGRGYSPVLLSQSCSKLFRETPTVLVEAFVKPDNVASLRAFIRAGFTETGQTLQKGQPAVRFAIRRDELA